MGKKGENIRMRKDGRWEGRYRVKKADGSGVSVRSVYGSSFEQVQAKLNQCRRYEREAGALTYQKRRWEMINEGKMPLSYISFGDVAKEWFGTIEGRIKTSTYVKYQNIYRKYLQTRLEEHHPALISSEYFREFVVGGIQEDGQLVALSESIEKSIYSVANQIMGYASERYHMDITYLVRKKTKNCRKPIKVFNSTEQKKLIRYLNDEMDLYKMGVLLCLHTGLRLGELCSLKWSDIDMENLILHVNSTVQRLPIADAETAGRTKLVETAPKSFCSVREIPISDMMHRLLLQFRHEGKYLFGGDDVADPRSYQKRFKRYLREAQIPYQGFHTLRHTFATNCAVNGTDIKSLSEILGHSDVKITLNRYVHPSMEIKRASLNQLQSSVS